MLTGDRGHLPRLCGVEGERLLAQHVLAGAERVDRHLVVVAVGGGDVDDVDVRIGVQVGVGAVRGRDRERSANASAASWVRDPTATTSASSSVCNASVIADAMFPVVAIPHLITFRHRSS